MLTSLDLHILLNHDRVVCVVGLGTEDLIRTQACQYNHLKLLLVVYNRFIRKLLYLGPCFVSVSMAKSFFLLRCFGIFSRLHCD